MLKLCSNDTLISWHNIRVSFRTSLHKKSKLMKTDNHCILFVWKSASPWGNNVGFYEHVLIGLITAEFLFKSRVVQSKVEKKLARTHWKKKRWRVPRRATNTAPFKRQCSTQWVKSFKKLASFWHTWRWHVRSVYQLHQFQGVPHRYRHGYLSCAYALCLM